MALTFYKDTDDGDYCSIAVWDYKDKPVYGEGGPSVQRPGDPAADAGNGTGWGINNQFREIADCLVDLDGRVTDNEDNIDDLLSDVSIVALSEKVSPSNDDFVAMADSEDSNALKKIKLSNLPGGGGGVSTFKLLTDTPSSYVGQAGKLLRVNVGETGLEFGDYYTDSEVDSLLGNKANSSHTHSEVDITDLDHTDDDAIHDNVAGEINALTEKATPANGDWLVIEDSADSNNKKKVQAGNLPGGGGGGLSEKSMSLEGNCYVADGIMRVSVGSSVTVSKIIARVITAPTGAALTLNVCKNADSSQQILTSDLSIAAGTNTATSTSIDTSYDDLVENDYLSLQITQVGSTVTGADLMVTIIF